MRGNLLSRMSTRGQVEMKWLLRFVCLSVFGAAIAIGLWPLHSLLWLMLLAVAVLSPYLLYALDRLEQRHPALRPWFNPFDKRSDSGQITIMGILLGFLAVVVYVSLIPALNAVIDPALSQVGTVEASLLRLIHLFFIVSILGTIYFYTGPGSRQG